MPGDVVLQFGCTEDRRVLSGLPLVDENCLCQGKARNLICCPDLVEEAYVNSIRFTDCT